MQFYKYESLGNNFILFDWLEKDENFISKKIRSSTWPSFVKKICKRNFGIGANGVLILKKDSLSSLPISIIFNSDGTKGYVCFNGIRCIANHLFSKHKFPNQFDVLMGSKKINCKVDKEDITTNVGLAKYIAERTIKIKNLDFIGHIVDVGNPHFVIFAKTTIEWLSVNGSYFENREAFPDKTNTEFVQQEEENSYNVLVYERGCGITLACSSGAAAIMKALLEMKKIRTKEIISLKMPGGELSSWIDENLNIYQKAKSHLVFDGNLNLN